MGSSNIKMDNQLKVLRTFKKYEDLLFSYFSKEKILEDNLKFYIVPKKYVVEFYDTFNYNKNMKELEQLNIYYDSPEKTDENKQITKDIISGIKEDNYYVFEYNIGLRKIQNKNLIEKITNDNKYIFKLNKEGLFIPLTYEIWDKMNRYYKCDIILEREGFVHNGEISIKTEEHRIDSFFIHNRTGDIIYHFCFIINDSFYLDKLYDYFKINNVKEFLDKFNIKHIENEIKYQKFQVFEPQNVSNIIDLKNHKLKIYFLDYYNFHKVEDNKNSYYIKDFKKSINIFCDVNEIQINNMNIKNLNNNMNNNINFVKNHPNNYNGFLSKKTFDLNPNFFSPFNSNINPNNQARFYSDKNIGDINKGKNSGQNNNKNIIQYGNKYDNINNNKISNNGEQLTTNSSDYKSKDEGIKKKVKNSSIVGSGTDSSFCSSENNSNDKINEEENKKIFDSKNYNTYINSILQCFFNIKKIKLNLKNLKIITNPEELLNLISNFFREIKERGRNIDTNYFNQIYNYIINISGSITPKIIIYTILNDLHLNSIGQKEKTQKGDINTSVELAFNEFKANRFKSSDFYKIYGGIFKKEYICETCFTIYYKFKTFFLITIDVDFEKNVNNDFLNFTKNLLKNDFQNEIISNNYSCKNCKESKFKVKKNIYETCPEILILFFNNKNEDENKYFYINFFYEIFLSNIEKNNNVYRYKLNSYIEYDINTKEYISCTSYNTYWKRMNKNETEKLNIKSIKKINNPQVLFYEKKNEE